MIQSLEARWLAAPGEPVVAATPWLSELLASAAEPGAAEHGTRVGLIAEATALAAGWPAPIASELRVIAALHDIGKVAVDEAILSKPGPLTPAERRRVETHPIIGHRILASRVPLLRRAARIARDHHERWDGTGYPRRLAGKQIDRRARVVAIADVYDALTSRRPYRDALTPEEALLIMRAGRGAQFEPALLDAFVDAASVPERRQAWLGR